MHTCCSKGARLDVNACMSATVLGIRSRLQEVIMPEQPCTRPHEQGVCIAHVYDILLNVSAAHEGSAYRVGCL
jgi:hypothetical protein